ncbi:hypothetical protein J6590_045001 [Homalodisca vitripennis]|nr:hypothetical protein J6590_045001 [Homalodisca vitripennis]
MFAIKVSPQTSVYFCSVDKVNHRLKVTFGIPTNNGIHTRAAASSTNVGSPIDGSATLVSVLVR